MDNSFKLPKRFSASIVYILLMPAFFVGFSLLYNPFDILGFFNLGGFSHSFHLMMLASIILVCLALTRLALWLILRRREIEGWHYALWCIGEGFLISCFAALYTTLFDGELPFFQSLGICMKFIFLSLLYPYIFLTMFQMIRNRSSEIASRETASDDSLVKFRDEHQRLKLTIDKSAVLSIKSELNYLEISYLDGEKVRTYLLRNSMRSQEDNAARYGFARCHRSWFVNPKHIRMLKKEQNGVYSAVLDTQEAISIPVSRQYYKDLSEAL